MTVFDVVHFPGLENLHKITSDGRTYELRIDYFKTVNGNGYAVYSNFSIANSADKYRLRFLKYTEGSGSMKTSFVVFILILNKFDVAIITLLKYYSVSKDSLMISKT